MPLFPGTYKMWVSEVAKGTSYSVLLSDSGTLFLASATATFTLPALAAGVGGVWWFYNLTDALMAITSATGSKLIMDGNATATTATFNTVSHRIGSFAMVWMNDAGTFYHFANLGNTTVAAS